MTETKLSAQLEQVNNDCILNTKSHSNVFKCNFRSLFIIFSQSALSVLETNVRFASGWRMYWRLYYRIRLQSFDCVCDPYKYTCLLDLSVLVRFFFSQFFFSFNSMLNVFRCFGFIFFIRELIISSVFSLLHRAYARILYEHCRTLPLLPRLQ